MSEAQRDKWNAHYRAGAGGRTEPEPFLHAHTDQLPSEGRALDAAGGAGRHALWLARRGLAVTLTDISEVALGRAAERAQAEDLPLRTLRLDLETEPFPAGPWDVIVCVRYLQRSLFQVFPERLAPGGALLFVQPTTTNLEKHAKPSRRFLLEPGELRRLADGLEIAILEESWSAAGFHEARLLAYRR